MSDDVETRGPGRYLWWLGRQLKGRVALGAMFGSFWFVSLALTPYLIAQAIDRGLKPHRPAALLAWAAILLVVGLASAGLGIMRHRSMTKLRLAAALRTADLVMTHAVRLGAALPRRVTAGEVVTIGISDVWTIGRAMNVGGVGVASTLACVVIAIFLYGTSPLLAAVVLIGVPVLALLVGPLLRRTQRAGSRYREQQGELNGRLVDVLGACSTGWAARSCTRAGMSGNRPGFASRVTGWPGRRAGSVRSARGCRWSSWPW
jgi:ABC-type multidrug transport system fused ATPase/permease subunit